MPLSSVAIKTSSHTRPPTWMFTGRTNEIEIVKEYFKAKDQDQQLFVLHGLDGAGKTETALKSIQLMKSRQAWKVTDLSFRMTKITLRFEGVVFINGSSRKSIEASLTGFAIDNRLGNAYTDALHWLDSRKTRWLMFFDNVDNPEVQVHEYFPRSGYSILITTKHNEIVRLAQGEGARCRVGELDPKQALTLLMKAAGNKDKLPESECVAAESLLQVGEFQTALNVCISCRLAPHPTGVWVLAARNCPVRCIYLSDRLQHLPVLPKVPRRASGGTPWRWVAGSAE